MKRAVIYYSLSGNTAEAAQILAEKLHADLIRLDTVKPMPDNNAARMMLGGMQASLKKCPPLKPLEHAPETYDEIILGTPVWAWKCAPPVRTFLSEHDVSEKVTAVFTCSLGTDDTRCIADLKTMLPNLRHTVTLCDKKGKLASENERKMEQFINAIGIA